MLSSLQTAAAMPPWVVTRIIDEDIEPMDFDMDADLIGISFMTYNAPRAYEIADRFRQRGKPVIFGGFHPTFLPNEAIKHADAVCIGEAEYNVPRMMRDFAAGRLKQFYRSGLVDLSGLPVADRDLIRKQAYITPDVLQATRGCPNACKFCSIAAFHRRTIRTRPVEEVLEELRALGRHVVFMDDNIIGDRDYAVELFSAMIPLRKRWFSQCGIGVAYDEELLRLAHRSGCRGLFIGFESLSQENLNNWRKDGARAKDYVRLVHKLHWMGIGVYAGFVFGSDRDTPRVFETTLEFLREAKLDALQATRLTPFPGTPLFDEMDRQGRIVDKDWSHYDFFNVVFEPRHMSPETLDRGTAWVLRQFYSRRRVAQRLWQELGYLNPTAFIRVVVPLNLGYRQRLAANGTFERGRNFVLPARSALQPRAVALSGEYHNTH
jgi:radical SAM superfamily enzyme YgiQ (UPF0313 family)